MVRIYIAQFQRRDDQLRITNMHEINIKKKLNDKYKLHHALCKVLEDLAKNKKPY